MRDMKHKANYDNEYIKNNYDRLSFVMPKGTKEDIKAYSKAAGLSSSEWVRNAIQEKMQRQDSDYTESITRERIEE